MAAHHKVFTEANIKSAFRGAGISPWNPETVIQKLDVRLRTPSLPSSRPNTATGWESQTPSNPQQTVSQSNFIKSRISAHQGSSPTPILEAVTKLAKGAQAMAHSITLLTDEVRTLQEANIALAKRRRAKRSRIQCGGALSIEESQALLAEKDKGKRVAIDNGDNGSLPKKRQVSQRRCGNCGKTGHNRQTCDKGEQLDDESDSDEFN